MLGSGAFQGLPNDGSQPPTKPLLWEYVRDQTGIPSDQTLLVVEKQKLRSLSWSSFPGYGP